MQKRKHQQKRENNKTPQQKVADFFPMEMAANSGCFCATALIF